MLYSVAATIHQLEQQKNPNKSQVEILYYHTDHLGTPRELTDRNGCIVWAATYKAWGNVAKIERPRRLIADTQGNVQIQRWEEQEDPVEQNRFQGQYFDQETGLHYNRFRYYDPDCGRFVSQDPIGLLGGSNSYQYAPNPVDWIDPLGLCRCPGDGAKATGPVPNLTERGTLVNLRPNDVAIAQRPVRTLVQDESGRYWLQTSTGKRITPSGSYDFVTMPDGSIRIARPNVNQDFSTHLGLSGGGEVKYAGSIRFGNNDGPSRGAITQWTNNSGYYQPPATLSGNAGLPQGLFNLR